MRPPTIGLVDYGAGNLMSVQAALDRLGAPWRRVASPRGMAGLRAILLPGVGRFGPAAHRLGETGLDAALRRHAAAGRPLFGICLGMHLLFEASAEDPGAAGLGLLRGGARRLVSARRPHIGWSVVDPAPGRGGGIFRGLPGRFFAYFAHSYAVPAGAPAAVARTSCPPRFASAVRRGAIWGVQFHPEKSGPAGAAILANFVARAGGLARASGATRGDGTTRGGGAIAGEDSEASRGAAPAGRARRVIACLDVARGRVVKGVRFRRLRDAGDPLERATAYARGGADEICLLDVCASAEGRAPDLDLVRRVARRVDVPLSVGGGVRTLGQMRALLLAGADRVSIGTAALADPGLIGRAAAAFGRQFVIVSVDARRRAGGWEATSHGGRRGRGLDAVAWAREAERLGAGEILLNAIDADGTRAGYALGLTRQVARAVRLPVVASGGAGGVEDMARAFLEGEADAVLAASIFHDGSLSIGAAKRALAAAGVEVRR